MPPRKSTTLTKAAAKAEPRAVQAAPRDVNTVPMSATRHALVTLGASLISGYFLKRGVELGPEVSSELANWAWAELVGLSTVLGGLGGALARTFVNRVTLG